MSYALVSRQEVAVDLVAATDFYRLISPKLAKQFLLRIREAKTYISQYPLAFQIKHNGVRTLLLKQFPYHIHYVVDDGRQQIVILAIIHAYKNPRDYSTR